MAVVANKCDMVADAPGSIGSAGSAASDRSEQVYVDEEAAKKFCEENGMLFVRASAKTGEGVSFVFASLASQIFNEVLSKRGGSS